MSLKISVTLITVFIIFQSCQKTISDFGDLPKSDSTVSTQQTPASIKDMRFYLITTDTVLQDAWRFRYDSVAKTLYQYETHDTTNYSNIPYISWLYNSKGQLLQMDYFDKAMEAGYSKSTIIDRSATGEPKSVEFISQTAAYCSNNIETNRFKGSFIYGSSNGKKTIRFIDTLSSPGGFANMDADYAVYFDEMNRPEYKILSRWNYYDYSCNLLYHPSGDTVFHIEYDAITGYPKTIMSQTIFLRGQGPVIGNDREKVTNTYYYSNKDNHKISAFFQNYWWGRDLRDWFTFNPVSNLYYILPGDDIQSWGDYQFLKYGIVDRIDQTDELMLDNVFSRQVYSLHPVYQYDSSGRITRCAIPEDNSFIEFSYY